ncbi:MAG: (d)CMP kinase [Rivularia sp. ALOHA_DT_140]|nr:(d)CMP kinase [Rivularia sp. ALOHA_DT_140]
MDKSINKTRVILIGGTSHAGKSTLAQSLAAKLGWNYLSTDKLARHPGRPWIQENKKFIPEDVVEHYKNLSPEELFVDVISHYEKNVLPQVEDIVCSEECLIIEGSALYPGLVRNLVGENGAKVIWLTASDQLFRNRIFKESNFDNVGDEEKYLIEKFLQRTLFYNQRMMESLEHLGFTYIDVESASNTDELSNKCIEILLKN